jgi:hypothetical protein
MAIALHRFCFPYGISRGAWGIRPLTLPFLSLMSSSGGTLPRL